jgi:hypothetical protein
MVMDNKEPSMQKYVVNHAFKHHREEEEVKPRKYTCDETSNAIERHSQSTIQTHTMQ